MKYTPSAFRSDTLVLTRWELIKLFFGQVLSIPGLTITTQDRKRNES